MKSKFVQLAFVVMCLAAFALSISPAYADPIDVGDLGTMTQASRPSLLMPREQV
jgi:hypothetical protein